jgi:O-antigen ligase
MLYLVSLLIGYAVGIERGLPTIEANAANRWMIGSVAFAGVILLAADGLSTWDRIGLVARGFVWCSVFLAVLGLLQNFLPFDPLAYMQVPGLQSHGLIELQPRGSGFRVPATTGHYLELSSTLAFAWPVALHFTFYSPDRRARRRYGLATLLITAGIAATISRTGIVAIGIAALVLMPLWPARRRYNVLAAGLVAVLGLTAVRPGLVRTIYSLFADASSDPSITSRTSRYEMIGFYFAQRPWLGRGTGTWVPPAYHYLDNQWLLTALENGIVGVAALAILHIVAIALAVIAFRRAGTVADRHFCLVLVAIQLIAMFVAYSFDSLAFSTYSTVLGLSIGLCGTVWRLTHPTRGERTAVLAGNTL